MVSILVMLEVKWKDLYEWFQSRREAVSILVMLEVKWKDYANFLIVMEM